MPDHYRRLCAGAAAAAMTAFAAPAAVSAPPPTPIHPVTDTYFGHKIVDPYRWLENTDDPAVKTWFKAQAEYASSYLQALPGRDTLLRRISALDHAGESVSDVQIAGPYFFYMKGSADANNDRLCVRLGYHGRERTLVDPDKLTKNGVHYSIDYFNASDDGAYVAVGISPGGSEESVIHVFKASNGRETGDVIDRGRFGDPNWLADGRSFYYNRLQKLPAGAPEIDEYRKSTVYLHVLGANPDNDPPVFGYGLSKTVSMTPDDDPSVMTSQASPNVIGVVMHGVLNEQTLYAAPAASVDGAATPWHLICDVPDDVTAFDVHGDTIYLLTHRNASRFKVIATSITHPDLAHARVIVPVGSAVITGLGAASDALYVQSEAAGIASVIRVPYKGKPTRLHLPYQGAIFSLVTDGDHPGVLFAETGWTHSALWYYYNPATNTIANSGLKKLSPVSFAGIKAIEVKARATDGVMIPLSIIYKKGIKLDGSNPTYMEGYGAYGIPLDPGFDPSTLAWLERGGVLATAHVRGGGEYGEDWHQAGMKMTKPNTWRDLIACAKYLIARGYTAPAHLAVDGASAGGITVGRAMTERPDLFGAVVDEVGESNALRSEFSPNGPPNIPEFGTVTTLSGFEGLLQMDAYQHVKDGVKYPAVLLTTGINDPRVASWEPAKMAARLQAATVSGKPVLLRVDFDAGHGMGSTKAQLDAEQADIYAFLFQQIGNRK